MAWEERKEISQDLAMGLLSFSFPISVLYKDSVCSAPTGQPLDSLCC